MMAICEKCIKQSVCKLCDGSEIMGCIEFVSKGKCVRASKGQESNCSEIPTGSEKLSSELEKNSKKLEKDFGESDCISRKFMCDLGATCIAYRNDKQELIPIISIDNLPPATPQEPRWISVSERLPEIHQDVILSLRSLDIEVGFRAETEPYFYCHGADGCYIEPQNVLAWQPLPEPYNVESEDKE